LDHPSLYGDIIEKRFALFEGWVIGPTIVRNIIKTLRALYENGILGPGDRGSNLFELSKFCTKIFFSSRPYSDI
jgi:chromatin structure-remodeling complex subunit RSC3/30